MKVPKYIKKYLKLREHHSMMAICYDVKITDWLEKNGAEDLEWEQSSYFGTGAIATCENGSSLATIELLEAYQPKGKK